MDKDADCNKSSSEGESKNAVPRVLFADRDLSTVELVTSCFAHRGWSLETVGLEASAEGNPLVERMKRGTFDVVVADLLMPGLDGMSLLRQIRTQRPSQPIIVVSACHSVGDFLSFMREGVSDVLQKPVDADSLTRAVRRAVLSSRDRERGDSVYRYVAHEETELVFTSRELADVRVSLGILDRLVAARMIDIGMKLRIDLAFQELVANALEHGNLELESSWKEDLDSQGLDRFSLVKRERLADDNFGGRIVKVSVSYVSGMLTVAVQDEGLGFIPDVPEEWKTESLDPHGRGLAMIFAATDEVEFSKVASPGHGTRVRFRKRLV